MLAGIKPFGSKRLIRSSSKNIPFFFMDAHRCETCDAFLSRSMELRRAFQLPSPCLPQIKERNQEQRHEEKKICLFLTLQLLRVTCRPLPLSRSFGQPFLLSSSRREEHQRGWYEDIIGSYLIVNFEFLWVHPGWKKQFIHQSWEYVTNLILTIRADLMWLRQRSVFFSML